MADEAKQAAGAADGAGATSPESAGKQVDKKETPQEKASDIAARQIAEQKAAKAIETVDRLNERLAKDPKFHAAFMAAWNGEAGDIAAAAKEADGKVGDGDGDTDENEELRRMLAETRNEIAELRNMYGYDKVSGAREAVNERYENDFRTMAVEAGYPKGSDAYETLYSDLLRESRSLAVKFGLVDKDGNPDPIKSYNREFLKEAFNNCLERHKRAGFYDAWQKKNRVEEAKSRKAAEDNEYARFLKPEKLRTLADRAKAHERMFRMKFPNIDKMT